MKFKAIQNPTLPTNIETLCKYYGDDSGPLPRIWLRRWRRGCTMRGRWKAKGISEDFETYEIIVPAVWLTRG